MERKIISFTSELEKKLAGKWVAFCDSDRKNIVGYADSLKELSDKVGDTKVVFSKVLDSNKIYAF